MKCRAANLAVLIGCLGLFGSSCGPAPVPKLDTKDHELWERTVALYLGEALWLERDRYDAGHYLMVPLHSAFWLGERNWQNQFATHFRRFVANADITLSSSNRLSWLQYLYLGSRFLVLSTQSERKDLIPVGLDNLLHSIVQKLWQEEPAWQWGREPFSGGIRERVLWKLSTKAVQKSYYRAIIDEELFLFAIAADIRCYERLTKPRESWSPTVSEILEVALRVFEEEVQLTDSGGWLFQPGVWWEHPDYAYAGHSEKVPGMQPQPVPGIAQETSHAHRFPLWLTSLADAYAPNEPQKTFYENLKKGLAFQFLNHVLVLPTPTFPSYRTTNFMDGHNGVYRWGYHTQGENNGYGPYELSGTLTLGWWAFLGERDILEVYRDMAKRFPLPAEVVQTYIGPNTNRLRHPLVSDPESYWNGFRELITRLASKIKARAIPFDEEISL